MTSADPQLLQVNERLNELEIKAAFQEQLITELSDALARESARIGGLQRQLSLLEQRLRSAADHTDYDPLPEPPPPHY